MSANGKLGIIKKDINEKALEIMQQETDILWHVGLYESSGFIFIGTYEQFEDNLYFINEGIRDRLQKALKVTKAKVKFLNKKLEQIAEGEYKLNQSEKARKYSIQKVKEISEKKLKIAIARKEKLSEEQKTFTNIQQRKVLAVYERISSPGKIIIIEGDAYKSGQWWLGEQLEYNEQ